jgi:Pvc16 N-terminal domain/Carboxypeptidase regulatory-like domain
VLILLDELLRQSLMQGVTGLREVRPGQPPTPVSADQVRFEAPDERWRSSLANVRRNVLNVYLVDLRENRKLRSNERGRVPENGVVYDYPAPARMDCHYLISAWSPTDQLTPQVEPVLDEHGLLYEVAAVLLRAGALNPSAVYPSGSTALNSWPEAYRKADLPIHVLPTDGFPKLAEFWGTMGDDHRWRPVLYLIVTLPVDLFRESAGWMVTTTITDYGQRDQPDSAEVLIQIGGSVLDSGNPLPDGSPRPVVSARVEIRDATSGQLAERTDTNKEGRFIFTRLRAGRYKLRASAPGLTMASPRDVVVPSLTGEYDLKF